MFKRLIGAALGASAASAAAAADISADTAYSMAERGELTIIDIRTPEEWRATGVPQGAETINMRDPAFGAKLQELLAKSGDTPIAMICASGARSSYVVSELEKYGLTDIGNIAEGMNGSSAGPGWLQRRLPVEAYASQ